jgi:single-strand DNA-binding protein
MRFMNFSSCQLMGRFVRDPERKQLKGTTVCNFSLAVSKKVKQGGKYIEWTSYFDCAAFGRTADAIAQYFTKGRPIFIDGHLKQERWERSGEKFSRVRVIVEQFQFIDSRNSGDDRGSSSQGQRQQTLDEAAPGGPHEPIPEEDIPF